MAVTAKLKCNLSDKPVLEGRQYDVKCEKVQPCGNIHLEIVRLERENS